MLLRHRKKTMLTDDVIAQVNEKNNQEDYQSALDIGLPILEENRQDYSLWVAVGNAYYGLKRYDDARQAYLTASGIDAQDVIALSNLAGLYFETNRFEEGLSVCDQALARQSDYVNVYIHRGNMLSSLNRYEEAVKDYQKALELSPDDPLVLFNFAYALLMTEDTENAKRIYQKLMEIAPDDPEYLFAYASFLEKTEEYETAAQTYLRLLEKDDKSINHIILGGCLYNLLLCDQTEAVFRLTDEWLQRFPDNPVALHTLETLKNSQEADRASAEYVRELFDAFADSFDSVLEGLSYQAPALVADAVQKAGKSFSCVLDLGCGTGLCGQALRKKIEMRSLTGVDLSAGMLEKARQRKIYTELIQSDIVSYLPENEGRFDLIVSSDVFTYLGDLSQLFNGLHQALKSGGTVVFTVSENKENDQTYAFELSGRFVHGRQYILKELKQAGFLICDIFEVDLRQELGKSVYGLLVTGMKK